LKVKISMFFFKINLLIQLTTRNLYDVIQSFIIFAIIQGFLLFFLLIFFWYFELFGVITDPPA